MKHYKEGSAVVIEAEIDQDLVSTTTITLESLFDPDDNEILSAEAMEYGTEDTNIASMVWQSTKGVDPVGKYRYVVKSLNGTYSNFQESFFFLEAR